MITVVAPPHRSARPLIRHQVPRIQVSQFCLRCDRLFRAAMARECGNCTRASVRVYGAAHPASEASGA